MKILSFLFLLTLVSTNAIAQTLDINPPEGLQTTMSAGQVTLSWTDKSNIEYGFRIERKIDSDAWKQLAAVGKDVQTYTDTVPYGNICYRVYAFASLASDFSNEACVKKLAPTAAPSAPTGVSLDANMVLKWEPSSGARGYHIGCATKTFSDILTEDHPYYATIYHISKLTPSQDPFCFIRAWNEYGESGYSAFATIPK